MSAWQVHIAQTKGYSVVDLLWGLGGMLALLALAVLFSADRRKIRVRTVGLALASIHRSVSADGRRGNMEMPL